MDFTHDENEGDLQLAPAHLFMRITGSKEQHIAVSRKASFLQTHTILRQSSTGDLCLLPLQSVSQGESKLKA